MNGREEKTSPLRLAWDLAMACRADVVYILREFSCLVIAVVLFPDIEQGPTIVAEARRSNVHVLWGTHRPMDRLAEALPARTPEPQYRSHRPPAAFPLGHAAGGGISHSRRPARPPRPSPQPPQPRHPYPGHQRPRGRRNRPLKSSPDHPIRSTAVKPHRLHPYPRAPDTPGGPAPHDRRTRIHQPHGTKLTQEKLK